MFFSSWKVLLPMMPPLRCNFPRFTLLFGERERERMNGRRRRDPANVRVAICPRTHLSITCPNYVSFLRAKSNSSEKEDRGWRGRVSSMSKHRFHCFSFPIIRAFDLLIDYVRKNIGRAGGATVPPHSHRHPHPTPTFLRPKLRAFLKCSEQTVICHSYTVWTLSTHSLVTFTSVSDTGKRTQRRRGILILTISGT